MSAATTVVREILARMTCTEWCDEQQAYPAGLGEADVDGPTGLRSY